MRIMDLTSWAREKALWNRKNWGGEYTNQLSELYVALYQSRTSGSGRKLNFMEKE
ncbi:hypothetical protein [Thermococcus sp. JCM 11816]|uniref:hypothetical protein n=1 Tax=Thermococcus sp. (strain JCM 11816 / KS-1) TaxID=1295125 RepID=UPI003467E1A8